MLSPFDKMVEKNDCISIYLYTILGESLSIFGLSKQHNSLSQLVKTFSLVNCACLCIRKSCSPLKKESTPEEKNLLLEEKMTVLSRFDLQ